MFKAENNRKYLYLHTLCMKRKQELSSLREKWLIQFRLGGKFPKRKTKVKQLFDWIIAKLELEEVLIKKCIL